MNNQVYLVNQNRASQRVVYERQIEFIDKSDFTNDRKDASRREAVRILDQYIEFMYAADYSDQVPRFWDATERLDKIRGHSIKEYIPELYSLLKQNA